MTTRMLRGATSLVRAWTRLYTSRLPRTVREQRRDEVESDLWESQHDAGKPNTAAAAFQMLLRLVRGIPDDLGWWSEQVLAAGVLRRQTLVMTGRFVGMAIVVATPWAISHDILRDRAIVVFAPGLTAQSGSTAPAGVQFDVISVKPNAAGRGGMTSSRVLAGRRFVAENMPVALLLGRAYQVQAYQVIGGPSWIWSDGFDIDARATGELAPAGGRRPLQGALQGLLASRFRLVAHNEIRQLPIFTLNLAQSDGRTGPNLTRSSRTDCAALLAQLAQQGPGGPPPPPPSRGQAPPCGAFNGIGALSLDSVTIDQLARYLAAELNRKVVDRTGLEGLFNVHLTWTPDVLPAGPLPPDAPPVDPNGPSIFTAVQEQLGFKLEPAMGPVDVLVIDRVERPAPN